MNRLLIRISPAAGSFPTATTLLPLLVQKREKGIEREGEREREREKESERRGERERDCSGMRIR